MTPEILLNAATLGASVQTDDKGFRQKDVRFLFELFASWQLSPTEREQHVNIHNTQIMRHLSALVKTGWASRAAGKGSPRYRLNRAGLKGVTEILTTTVSRGTFSDYNFIAHFFASYRERILQLKDTHGAPLPLGLRQELNLLLNMNHLKKTMIQNLEREINYWEARIQETLECIEFAKNHYADHGQWPATIKALQTQFPYELNSQKPLSYFFRDVPVDLQRWEIFEGNKLRIANLWKPRLEILKKQRDWLD
jgi:hypothetical protein